MVKFIVDNITSFIENFFGGPPKNERIPGTFTVMYDLGPGLPSPRWQGPSTLRVERQRSKIDGSRITIVAVSAEGEGGKNK